MMFTIGEFSKLGHISARMLRHYDVMGLLHPAYIGDENGYRYYDGTQLARLGKIEALKGYGFSLAEIRTLLELPEGKLAERLHTRRLRAYDELEQMRKTIRRMEDQLVTMEGTGMYLDQYKVTVMENPAQRVLALRRTISISQVNELFEELLERVDSLGLRRSGACQQVYLGEEFSYDNMDVEVQVEVAGEHPDIREIPACTCVCTVHKGSYDRLKYAYEAIGAWMSEHPGYQVAGPGIERYLVDVDTAKGEENLETGVLFPVKQIPA